MILTDGNREREETLVGHGDCGVTRAFVAKVIELFFFFFILLSRGITSGSTSSAQSGSISVLCVRLQSTRRSNIYSNTCVVCKLVVRVRVHGPVAHMHKAGAYTGGKTPTFVCVRSISPPYDLYTLSSIEIVSRLRILSIPPVIILRETRPGIELLEYFNSGRYAVSEAYYFLIKFPRIEGGMIRDFASQSAILPGITMQRCYSDIL